MEINERNIIQKANLIGEKIRAIDNWEELCKHSNKSIIEFYEKKTEKKNQKNMENNPNEKFTPNNFFENR